MKVTHVVPHIDQEASGPSYSVPRLCRSLAEQGNEVELKCLAANGPIDGVRVSVHRQWRAAARFAISTDMALALQRVARDADIVHNHSLWSMVNVAAGCVVPGNKAKLVTSPRGTLSTWALQRSRRVKQILWPLQQRALRRADLLHATSAAEYGELRALGLAAPIAIIPNGIDLPVALPQRTKQAWRTLLFLSRIHPKKGIDNLLGAWHQVQAAHADWRLVIAGTGEPDHVAHVRELAGKLGVQRVEFPGPLYGDAKTAAYRSADLFVLPTHSENFGLAVAEALAHGCPAIVTRGAPWQGLEAEQCGWWIDNDANSLAATMDAAMSMRAEALNGLGERGRAWMERDFSWSVVGGQMDIAYRWLLEGGVVPPFIRLM